jgi:hypothetical protein
MLLNTKLRLLMNIKENFYVYIYKEVLTFLGWFTATDALLAARCILIMPYACG